MRANCYRRTVPLYLFGTELFKFVSVDYSAVSGLFDSVTQVTTLFHCGLLIVWLIINFCVIICCVA
jgi:uncharacterized membrane protein YciS (DUF1049 family)